MAKPNPEVVGGQLSRLAALWQPGRRSLPGRQKNGLRARGKRSMTMKYDDLEKLELTGMKLSQCFSAFKIGFRLKNMGIHLLF